MNEILKNKIKELPKDSGVYLMKSIDGQVIYVGKAKNLKNRVSQYFNKGKKLLKVQAMVDKIYDFDYFITLSERDAFALENNLIKQYQPFYNILLKDSKTFPYIKVDLKEYYPRFEVTRRISKKDGVRYFGPYISGLKPYDLLKIINYAYPLRTCSLKINEKQNAKRECLNFFLGLCSAPCTNRISREDYLVFIHDAMDFLNGNDKKVENILLEKMQNASQNENFEKAIEYRDAYNMVQKLKEKVVANLPKDVSFDVFAYHTNGLSSAISILTIRAGKILGVQSYSTIDASLEDSEAISSFINQYYQNIIPAKEILVSCKFSNTELEEYLTSKLGKKVDIICPEKAYKKHLVDMAMKNAKQHLEKNLALDRKKYERSMGAIEKLKQALNLPVLPKRIECYDISNISGTNQVSSMTVFTNGEKDRKEYRKFKIKYVQGQNDFECMKETLRRRLTRFKDNDLSFSKLPDLIVIDGGKGQLSSAVEVLEEFKINIPIISLAEKFEEVYVPNSSTPIMFKKGSVELGILTGIRDEAHRFAITFHRNLRTKKMLSSPLDEIKGIGEIKKKNLLKVFKTTENIKSASIEELSLVKGIDKNLAENIYNYFKNNN